ncbi:HORMA domain-containing protein 2-like [Artemia franciscana]|uniref:HORMA domain-containing protein 2-like n=1 Tax=Artemia franciscana TaxID=6661 RepID=UPI0032D9EE11
MAKVCQEVKQNQPQLPKFYAVEDQQSSQSYIVKLLTVSVSTIAYMKNLYNENDYTEFSIKGGNCKVLNIKSKNPDCKHLLGLLKGAFDAIGKQYLRELVLGIYTDPRDREGSFVESFNFLFEYGDGNHVTLSYKPNGEGKMSSKNKMNRKDVNRISKDLLDVLYSFCYNSSFSGKKEYLTMKFYYYPNTPHDYQPPGFRRANDKEYDFLKQSKSNAAIVADVKTPWHSLGVGRPTENRPKNIHEHDADNIPRTKIQHCNESDLTLDLKNLAMSIKENVTPAFGTVKYPATDAEPVAAHGSHVDTVVSSNPASPILSLIKEPGKGLRRRRKISHGNLAPSSSFGRKRLEKSSTSNLSASAITSNLDDGMAPVYLKSPDLKRNFIPSVATPKSDEQSFSPQRFSAVNALLEMRCRYPAHTNSATLSPVTNGPSAEPETAFRKDLIAAGPSNASSGQDLNDDGTIFIKCICESQCATDILLQCSFCKTTQHPVSHYLFGY